MGEEERRSLLERAGEVIMLKRRRGARERHENCWREGEGEVEGEAKEGSGGNEKESEERERASQAMNRQRRLGNDFLVKELFRKNIGIS